MNNYIVKYPFIVSIVFGVIVYLGFTLYDNHYLNSNNTKNTKNAKKIKNGKKDPNSTNNNEIVQRSKETPIIVATIVALFTWFIIYNYGSYFADDVNGGNMSGGFSRLPNNSDINYDELNNGIQIPNNLPDVFIDYE